MRWRPLLAGLAVSAVAFAAFWELAGVYADSSAVAAFDAKVSAAIQSFRTPPLTALMLVVTSLGSTAAVAVVTVVVVVLLWRRERRVEAIYAGTLVAVGGLLIAAFKNAFDRARPPVENALITPPESFSFPSGHTMGSLCLAWVLGWVLMTSDLRQRTKLALLVLCASYPVAVGTSRVYLGVHWPSDVLASWLLGVSVIAAATGIRVACGESRRGDSGR